MRSGCEPSASVRGLSLDVSDPSLSLGSRVRGDRGMKRRRVTAAVSRAPPRLDVKWSPEKDLLSKSGVEGLV